VPIFLPQRTTPSCASWRNIIALMSVHVNHPRELTIEVKQALERLANAGYPAGKSELRFRCERRPETMKTLVHKLLMPGAPYYIYQCDLIADHHIAHVGRKGSRSSNQRTHHRLRGAAIRHRRARRRW
jgi:lysine 2,3-aminomutase